MSDKKEQNKIWINIGRFGTVLSAIWIIFQAYKNFPKNNSIDVTTNGQGSFYSVQADAQNNLKNYESLKKGIEDDLFKIELDTKFNNAYKELYSGKKQVSQQKTVELLTNYKKLFSKPIESYNTVWRFNIKNNDTQSIEELFLELPNTGNYAYSSSEGITKTGIFNNRIELGNLKPTHALNIVVWTNEFYFNDILDTETYEEKVRFTHKSGAISINFPTLATGLLAWIAKIDGGLIFFISIFLLFVIFTFTFYLGKIYGPKLDELEIKQKIEELNKLEEWKKKNEDKIKDIKEGSE